MAAERCDNLSHCITLSLPQHVKSGAIGRKLAANLRGLSGPAIEVLLDFLTVRRNELKKLIEPLPIDCRKHRFQLRRGDGQLPMLQIINRFEKCKQSHAMTGDYDCSIAAQ